MRAGRQAFLGVGRLKGAPRRRRGDPHSLFVIMMIVFVEVDGLLRWPAFDIDTTILIFSVLRVRNWIEIVGRRGARLGKLTPGGGWRSTPQGGNATKSTMAFVLFLRA